MIGGDVERTNDPQRAARALRMLRESMHACAHGDGSEDLLHAICDILIDTGGFATAWSALGSARALAADVDWENNRDPVVRAFDTHHLQVELLEAPGVPRLVQAAGTGARAVAVLPLVEDDSVFGVIEVHARERFAPEEIAALDELATNVSFAIAARRTRSELRDSERHLNTLLDNFPDLIVRFDARAHLVYVNPAVERAFQIEGDQLAGKPVRALPGVPPESLGLLQESIQRVFLERRANAIEMRFDTRAGRRMYEVRHIPELDERGRVVGVLGLGRDVTERTRAQQALVESERAYRSLAEHIPDFIVRWDRDLRRMYVNPAFARTLRRLPEELIGTPIGEGYERADHEGLAQRGQQVRAWVQRVFETGTAMSAEMQWVDRGQSVTQDLRIVPEVDARGTVASVLGIGRDITALKRSQRVLRTLIDNSPDVIARFDAQGRYAVVNKAIERATGIPEAQWIGRLPGDVMGVDAQGRRIPAYIPLIKLIESMYVEPRAVEIELVLPVRDKSRMLNIRLAPELDEQGHLTSILLIGRDITEHRALEDRLREAQKMEAIGQLAGGIAHDFNNLLVVVLMQAGLASQPDASPEVMRSALKQITEVTERAAQLTTQLLTFSRRQVAQLVELDLREIVAKSANLLRSVVGDRVAIEVYIRGALPRVMADPSMIEQILVNLGLNARDAMPMGGKLVVALEQAEVTKKHAAAGVCRKPGPHVCLEVTDTGSGIDPADLPRIFEPFYTTKPTGKGSGLGLATVFGIVQQHQGWIDVESVVRKGTTFRIYFPAIEVAVVPPGARPGAGARAVGHAGGETILLVEDNDRVRVSVREMLEAYSYRVVEADSPAAALRLWEAEKDAVALLLTDLVMPGSLTALQLAETLLAKQPRLKVVYMTGYGAEIASKLLRVPGRVVLQKPFSPEALATCLRQALDEPVHG